MAAGRFVIGGSIAAYVDGGYKHAVWDSTDNGGKAVPSGIHIYCFDANSLETDDAFHQTRKMVLLR